MAPRKRHTQALHLSVHYVSKNDFKKAVFDPSISDILMPEPLGKPGMISAFVHADHAENVAPKRSNTGILSFVNNSLIILLKPALVDLHWLKSIVFLKIKLNMFDAPLLGPVDCFCDNNGVFKNMSIPE